MCEWRADNDVELQCEETGKMVSVSVDWAHWLTHEELTRCEKIAGGHFHADVWPTPLRTTQVVDAVLLADIIAQHSEQES